MGFPRRSAGFGRSGDGLVAAPLRVQRRQGGGEYVSVAQSVQTVADVAGKPIQIRYVQGPVGVQSRNFSNERI